MLKIVIEAEIVTEAARNGLKEILAELMEGAVAFSIVWRVGEQLLEDDGPVVGHERPAEPTPPQEKTGVSGLQHGGE